MARNIFRKMMDSVRKPNRNTFDLSFTHNLTAKFGQLTPVFCKEVMPGDSFDITPSFALRLMPMVFPIQSTIKARLHFFFVRNKNIWKEWPDFIGNQKPVEMPYLSGMGAEAAQEIFSVGGIADRFGIPTTVHGSFGVDEDKSIPVESELKVLNLEFGSFGYPNDFKTKVVEDSNINYLFSDAFKPIAGGSTYLSWSIGLYNSTPGISPDKILSAGAFSLDLVKRDFPVGDTTTFPTIATVVFCCFNADSKLIGFITCQPSTGGDSANPPTGTFNLDNCALRGSNDFTFNPIGEFTNSYADVKAMLRDTQFFAIMSNKDDSVSLYETINYSSPYVMTETLEYNDLPISPYTNGLIKISALPFRAYESIYNGFYRDTRNNPLIVDGQPEYNQFNTTTDSGPDATPYKLFNANWESDFLTTATQTPQQGIAPLIGITGTGLMSFQDADGNTIYAQAKVGEDGNTILGIQSYDTNLPAGTLQILQDTISAGISIADVRNVNALQRWLERNLRLGFRYKELVKAQFGVDINWSELDMPEFIGGVTKDIIINQISQTVNGSGGVSDSLGSYAGQGGVVGQGQNVRHYCDDYGFIIGILSVVPVPIYTQIMPKMFLRKNCLDYYAPDFGHIGAQPIFYDEVAPLQVVLNDVEQSQPSGEYIDNLKSVFGYQRAWYEYIQSTDFASGQFRTSLRNFLFNRTFDNIPELGEQFLTVDSSHLNDVFVVNEDTDKILGELYFDVKAKRPIPEFSIPRLES